MSRVLLIGGPGNISGGCAEELVAGGHPLAILKRSDNADPRFADTVRFYRGDRGRPSDLKAAIDDFRPDAVVDFVCFEPERVEELVPLLPEGAHYVLVSTVDTYGYPLTRIPMREDDPRAPTRNPYGANKRACEERVARLLTDAGRAATVVRPTYSFGTGSGMMSLFAWGGMAAQVARMRAGMPVLVPGDGNTILHASCAHDVGRMIARVAQERDTSAGKSYTCGHDGALTFDGYMALVAGVLGVQPELVHVPVEVLLAIDSEEVRGSFVPSLTRYNMCFSVEAFKRDIPDFAWRMSLEEGVRRYVEWYDRHGLFPDAGEEIYEDRLIRAWQKCLAQFHL
jgi:nucleoside-diphosphate-sugar epimerase